MATTVTAGQSAPISGAPAIPSCESHPPCATRRTLAPAYYPALASGNNTTDHLSPSTWILDLALLPSNYPTLDVTPPTDSAQVKQWLSEIDLTAIPAIQANGLNGCSNTSVNAAAIANASASGNCWWTCGGCTRATDISYCPEKDVWGLSYDDGPSPYTPRILNLLNEQDIQATFFVVGSRAISRPAMLATGEYSCHSLAADRVFGR